MSTDELTRLRTAFTTAPPDEPPRADCPPAGQIWEGVRGELGPTDYRELIQHLTSCPVCTEAWRLAEKLEKSEDGLEDEAPPGKPSATWHRWLRVAGTAAAASLVLVVGLQLHDGEDPAAVLRAPGSEDIGLGLLSEDPLPRDNFLLRWQGPEDAVYYDLRVSSVDDPSRTLAADAEIRAKEFRVPPEALMGLPSGADLLIHLTAYDPIEGSLDSDTFSVTVK